MAEKKRPDTQFIPIATSQAETPVVVAPPSPSPAEQGAPEAPLQPTAPPPDKPFSGRGVSQKTARWRMEQSRNSGMMLTLIALFVILLYLGLAV